MKLENGVQNWKSMMAVKAGLKSQMDLSGHAVLGGDAELCMVSSYIKDTAPFVIGKVMRS